MSFSSKRLKEKLFFKVGLFTLLGFCGIFCSALYLNNHPSLFWRECKTVKVEIVDATGLKNNSTVFSMGIEVGYLNSVELKEDKVLVNLCLNQRVEVLPNTRAFIRSEGFFGDKFIELKPLKVRSANSFFEMSSAQAADKPAREIEPAPVVDGHPLMQSDQKKIISVENIDYQKLLERVDTMVGEISKIASQVKESIEPDQLRATINELHQVLKSTSRMVAPEGGLNQTAQRALSKLESAIEQLNDLLTRVNHGEGSVGMLLNKSEYADELMKALKNLNQLLNRAANIKFLVDLGGMSFAKGVGGGRGYFGLAIWPSSGHYYLLGLSADSRGSLTYQTITTTVGGVSQTTTSQLADPSAILLSAMLGRVFFQRLDLSAGILYSDGAFSINGYLGPQSCPKMLQLKNDFYVRSAKTGLDLRSNLLFFPIPTLYIRGGIESMNEFKTPFKPMYSIGLGVQFDDDDIRLLFSLR